MVDPPTRVLVTGGAGYIGAALVKTLADRDDIELVVSVDISHDDETQTGDMRDEWPHSLIKINQDVRESLTGLLTEYRIDTVMHLAFLLQTQRDETYARSVNVDATANLLQACAASPVTRFIYLSSTSVYGARSGNTGPFTETDRPDPTDSAPKRRKT